MAPVLPRAPGPASSVPEHPGRASRPVPRSTASHASRSPVVSHRDSTGIRMVPTPGLFALPDETEEGHLFGEFPCTLQRCPARRTRPFREGRVLLGHLVERGNRLDDLVHAGSLFTRWRGDLRDDDSDARRALMDPLHGTSGGT